MPRPAFISLDGLDGTGKSTQCQLLAEWLSSQKIPATVCVDPGGTALGQKLREILLFGKDHRIAVPTEAFLFMASRAQLVEEVIRPALDRSEVVISDRYLLANVVYQGHAGGMPPKDLWAIGRVATGGLEPDLTLVFDVDLEVAFARRTGTADRMEDRGRDFHARVQTGFRYEAGMRPGPYQIVDATPDPATVHQVVRQKVGRLLTDYGWPVAAEG